MKPTDSEVKEYGLNEKETKNFFKLINISSKDFEVISGFEKDNPHVFVKFDERFSTEQVNLIMKVAVTQLKARISRQKEWDKLTEVYGKS